MEQLDYNLLFRWFVGLEHGRSGLGRDGVHQEPRAAARRARSRRGFSPRWSAQARAQGLLSDEHFTVDGTLIEAWAGHKSFKRKDAGQHPPPDDPGNPTVDFHGERRSNDTHQSTTDPEARLARKERGRGGQAQLRRARADGEPQRPRGQRLRDPGRRPRRTAGGAGDGGARSRAGSASPWAPTRATTAGSSFRNCAITRSPRTSRASRPASSTSAPLVIRATRSASKSANGSKKSSAGSRPSGGLRKTRHRGVGAGRLDVHLRAGGLQPGQDAQPAARADVNQPLKYPRCLRDGLNRTLTPGLLALTLVLDPTSTQESRCQSPLFPHPASELAGLITRESNENLLNGNGAR